MVSAIYDGDGDDMAAEAERIAREYVEWQQRWEEIRQQALALVRAVHEEMVSAHIAHGAGMHGAMQDAVDRAAVRIEAVDDIQVLRDALLVAGWEGAQGRARELLLQLRDCHYIDADHGLIPIPPGRHRAREGGR